MDPFCCLYFCVKSNDKDQFFPQASEAQTSEDSFSAFRPAKVCHAQSALVQHFGFTVVLFMCYSRTNVSLCLFVFLLSLCHQLCVCVQSKRVFSSTRPPAGPPVHPVSTAEGSGHERVQGRTLGHLQTPAHHSWFDSHSYVYLRRRMSCRWSRVRIHSCLVQVTLHVSACALNVWRTHFL